MNIWLVAQTENKYFFDSDSGWQHLKESVYLESVYHGLDVSQQVLSQLQAESGLALHWLVQVDVQVHRTITLTEKRMM